MPSTRHPLALLSLAALVAIAVLAFAGTTSASASERCAGADVSASGQSARSTSLATLCLVNAERLGHGLRPLLHDARLARAGAAHARDMVRRRYFAHRSLDGRTPVQRILASGYARSRRAAVTGGENLGWAKASDDSPRDMVDAWMASPPHRRVILFAGFRRGGVATTRGIPVATTPGTTYALETGD